MSDGVRREEGQTRLPSFVVIGAPKAGTTSLYEYLRGHHQVYMPRLKEPDFFSASWERGIDWYARLFSRAGDAIAIGEASTSYSKHPHHAGVPRRIAAVLPDVRLIYVLRHPIRRMSSQYLFRLSKGWERAPVDEALLSDPLYLDCSRYAMQLEQYLEVFDRERILMIMSEDLRSDRPATLRKVYAFIGVDPDRIPPCIDREFNTGTEERIGGGRLVQRRFLQAIPGYRALAPRVPSSVKALAARPFGKSVDSDLSRPSGDVVRRLEDLLRDDVSRLRAHFDGDLDGWGIA